MAVAAFSTLFSSVLCAKNVQSSPYLSLEYGFYHYDIPEVDANFFGEGGGTVRVAIGKLWDTKEHFKLGLEIGSNFITTDKGTPDTWFAKEYGTYKSKRFSVDALSVAEVQIDKVNIFAKAGVAYTRSKFEQNTHNYGSFTGIHYTSSAEGSHSDLRPKGGIGCGYDLSDKVSVYLALNHEFASDGGTAALMGLRYQFA